MSINPKQLTNIATLARLHLNEEQAELLQKPINAIVALADQLAQQSTEGVTPLAHPLALIQEILAPLRADVVTEADNRSALLSNAPAEQQGLFLVPKVID